MMCLLFTLVCLLVIKSYGAKDNSYYPGGNKLVDERMYWADSVNVLQDLDQFEKLYVTFHNCAMSSYGSGGEDNPCGFAAMSDEYWYMEESECVRANAAYSLYGVLQGEEDKGCSKKTFINSFHTTAGVESFLTSIANAGFEFSANDDGEEEVTSDCATIDENEEDGDYQENNGFSHNAYVFPGVASYGLACSATSFAKKYFDGAYCNNRRVRTVDDKLETFNREINQAQCVQIYSSQSDEQQQDGQNGNQQESIQLLTYSKACRVQEAGSACPDPFGKLHHYEKSLRTSSIDKTSRRWKHAKRAISWILLLAGIVLMVCSCLVRSKKSQNMSGAEKRRKIWCLKRNKDAGGVVTATGGKKKKNCFRRRR